jgi:hypothetical protein
MKESSMALDTILSIQPRDTSTGANEKSPD